MMAKAQDQKCFAIFLRLIMTITDQLVSPKQARFYSCHPGKRIALVPTNVSYTNIRYGKHCKNKKRGNRFTYWIFLVLVLEVVVDISRV